MFEALINSSILNRISIGFFVLAKFCGILGIIIAFAGFRNLGGSLLALDGILLLACIICCIAQMHKQNKDDIKDKDVLDKMLSDGSLHQRLQEAGYKLVSSK